MVDHPGRRPYVVVKEQQPLENVPAIGPSWRIYMSGPYLYHGVQLERRGFFKA